MTRCNNCNELYPINDTGRMTPRHLVGFCPDCQESIKRALESRPKRYSKLYLPPLDEDAETSLAALRAFKDRPDFKEYPQGWLGTQTESDVVEEFFYGDDVEYSLLMVKSTSQELIRVAYEWDSLAHEVSGYWMSGLRLPFSRESVKDAQKRQKMFDQANNIPVTLILKDYPFTIVPFKKTSWIQRFFDSYNNRSGRLNR